MAGCRDEERSHFLCVSPQWSLTLLRLSISRRLTMLENQVQLNIFMMQRLKKVVNLLVVLYSHHAAGRTCHIRSTQILSTTQSVFQAGARCDSARLCVIGALMLSTTPPHNKHLRPSVSVAPQGRLNRGAGVNSGQARLCRWESSGSWSSRDMMLCKLGQRVTFCRTSYHAFSWTGFWCLCVICLALPCAPDSLTLKRF